MQSMTRVLFSNLDLQKVYFLVLCASGATPHILSKPSPNIKQVRANGRQIAHNLDLNYFDISNISKFHEVRHTKVKAP